MKFWIAESPAGEVLGCHFTKRQVLEWCACGGWSSDEVSLQCIEVEVTAESIRLLLGGHGGYAKQA